MLTWLLLIRLCFSLTKFFVFILWGILLEPVSFFGCAAETTYSYLSLRGASFFLTFHKSLAAEINQQILDWRQYTPNLG